MPSKFLMFFRYVFHCYLFSPFLVLVMQGLWEKKPRFFRTCVPYTLHYAPLLLFFLLPSLFCAFSPIPLAVRISPQAEVATLDPGIWLDTDSMTISRELTSEETVSQSFVAERDQLAAVGVKLTNFKRSVTAQLRFFLYDASGVELASETARGQSITNNSYFAFQFPPIVGSKGKHYSYKLVSPDATPGNAFAVFVSSGDIYPAGKCSVNGKPESKAMLFRLYYGQQETDNGRHP